MTYTSAGYDSWKTTDPSQEGAECPECDNWLEEEEAHMVCTHCGYSHAIGRSEPDDWFDPHDW